MLAQEIASALLEANAVKVKTDPPFKWVSGILSPVYCDNRLMISHPEARKLIVEGFKKMIEDKGITPDAIAGTATAAIPWAAFVAYDLNLPMVMEQGSKLKELLQKDKRFLSLKILSLPEEVL